MRFIVLILCVVVSVLYSSCRAQRRLLLEGHVLRLRVREQKKRLFEERTTPYRALALPI